MWYNDSYAYVSADSGYDSAVQYIDNITCFFQYPPRYLAKMASNCLHLKAEVKYDTEVKYDIEVKYQGK